MSRSIRIALRRMVVVNSWRSGRSGASTSIRSENPTMPVSGLRRSCAAIPRSCVLRSFASRSASLVASAASRAASASARSVLRIRMRTERATAKRSISMSIPLCKTVRPMPWTSIPSRYATV